MQDFFFNAGIFIFFFFWSSYLGGKMFLFIMYFYLLHIFIPFLNIFVIAD